MKRKMPIYTLMVVIRAAAWIALATAAWVVKDPRVLLVSFLVLYATARLMSGPAGLAFFDVVVRMIPARRRGRFFSWRQLLGELLALPNP